MFFRKFPRFSGYSSPSSSTIRSALWENAHPSLAAVGATAGGALLPISVLSCSPRWSQEGQHQKTVTNCIPKLCSRHSAVGLVGLFVCTIILQIPFVCVTGAALENPVRPSQRLKRGWILLFDASTWSSGKVEADGAKHTLPCG